MRFLTLLNSQRPCRKIAFNRLVLTGLTGSFNWILSKIFSDKKSVDKTICRSKYFLPLGKYKTARDETDEICGLKFFPENTLPYMAVYWLKH
jgi:hypothetical protein